MKKLLSLAIIFMCFISCSKTSENPEDYINFMINNEFQLKYIKNDLKGIEWERGGVQKGVQDFKMVEELKVKFYIKNVTNQKYDLYYTSMSGLVNEFLGQMDAADLKEKWKNNKKTIGSFQLAETNYIIDLNNETIQKKSKRVFEVFRKIKS
jgi:hypothetical protein